jgi:hypothetical protein
MLTTMVSGFTTCRTSNFTQGLEWIGATASDGFARRKKQKLPDGGEQFVKAALLVSSPTMAPIS